MPLLDRAAAAELAAAARRIGGLEACLFLLHERNWLVELPAEDEGYRLPFVDSFSGGCVASGRAQIADLGQDVLHPRERAALRAAAADHWLAVPIVIREDESPVGIVVGLKAGPLTGAGEHQLATLSLVAQHVALYRRVRDLEQAISAERARARELTDEAAGILHSLRSAALVLTADGRVHDGNRSAEILLGFQIAEARDSPAREVIDWPEVVEVLETVQSTGGGQLPEVRLGDNPAAVYEVRITPVFDARGELRWRVVVFNDTTLLRQADELKSEFVSMVSHELRTPLTSIKAFASTLLRAGCDGRPEDRREWLRIIDHECDRLTALINDLLSISQLESGQPMPLDYREFDLMPLLRDIGETQLAATRKHQLAVIGPSTLSIEADPAKIRQVVANLVSNAVKYSPGGGEIRLVVDEAGEEIRLLVQDQGQGIRPEHLNLVFEKFFQVDGSTTRRVGGTGLGLYLARRLVQAHCGKIWAESEFGVGSTFVVTLPRRRPPEGAETPT